MAKINRWRHTRPQPSPTGAQPPVVSAESGDAAAWSRVLSLTGALLSHLAARPETQRMVSEMLAAGVTPPPDTLMAGLPFEEPLDGLQTRELRDTDLFHKFFGRSGQAPGKLQP